MKILVVAKTTNLDLHGENIRKKIALGLLPQDYLARLLQAHKDHHETLGALYQALAKYNCEYVEVGRGLYWPDLHGFDGVITVGGDGTVLEASHHIVTSEVSLVGVRSSPTSVGFLCACDRLQLDDLISKMVHNKLNTRRTCRLKANIHFIQTQGTISTDPILNDFLFTNISPAATTRYTLTSNKRTQEQKSSGLWVSTPAGSTAAILAAGGHKMPIESTLFQFIVRELYRTPGVTETWIDKGEFDPDKNPLELENRCDQAMLALDGQHGVYNLSFGDRITFLRAPPLWLVRSL